MKERLVGAAVLIAVAVWLIPWVLDGPEAPLETTGGSVQLPAAEEPMPMRTQRLPLGDPEPSAATASNAGEPPVEAEAPPPVAATPPPAEAAEADDAPAVAAVREPERAAPVATPPTPPPARAAAAPAASSAGDWTVQLGVFGEEANARRLAQRTSTFGYKAEVSSYRSGDRNLYRVRVGSLKTRGEAEAMASALKAHGLNDARVVAAR